MKVNEVRELQQELAEKKDLIEQYDRVNKDLVKCIEYSTELARTLNQPIAISKEMIEAGAQRLVSWEGECVWPYSWDSADVAAARGDAERVLRSALSFTNRNRVDISVWESVQVILKQVSQILGQNITLEEGENFAEGIARSILQAQSETLGEISQELRSEHYGEPTVVQDVARIYNMGRDHSANYLLNEARRLLIEAEKLGEK